jgi:hypothetical protein
MMDLLQMIDSPVVVFIRLGTPDLSCMKAW